MFSIGGVKNWTNFYPISSYHNLIAKTRKNKVTLKSFIFKHIVLTNMRQIPVKKKSGLE